MKFDFLVLATRFSFVGAFLGVIVLSLVILFLSGGTKELRVLVSGADATGLGEVSEVLKSNQIDFEYGSSGDSILVPADKLAAARMELAMKGLPRAVMLDMKFSTKEILASVILYKGPTILVLFKVSWRTISMMDAIRSARFS